MSTADSWELYRKIKELVTESRRLNEELSAQEASQLANRLRELLREYARLKPPRPDLCFSRLLFQVLRFPEDLEFLPAFMRWSGLNSFQEENYKAQIGGNDRVFEPLLETVARKVGKVSQALDDFTLKEFSVQLIDKSLNEAENQKPEWLNYYKALLLNQLGQSENSRKLLISFVQQKGSDYWTWHALAKVVEDSDPKLALAACAKAYLTCKDEKFGVNVFEDLSRLAAQQNETQLAKWSANRAFTVRDKNGWKIPQSLRNLLNITWYAHAHAENLHNLEEILLRIAADAEKIIWAICPQYDVNYLGTFLSKSEKKLVKFGLLSKGESQELVSPARGLLNNLNLAIGDPVKVTVDESGDRSTVVVIEKRESGKAFDSMSCKTETGQFRLKQGGFGFVGDVHVPHDLASQLEDRQTVSLIVMKRFNKKKNQWGLTAIAAIDE